MKSVGQSHVWISLALVVGGCTHDRATNGPGDSISSHDDALAPLRDQVAYAQLDQRAVKVIAMAARAHWPEALAGFTFRRVEEFSSGDASYWMSIWSHDATGLEFSMVPGGRFQMGSPMSETGRDDDEESHWVALDPFLIARTECTIESWNAASLDARAHESGRASIRHPKVGLSPEQVEDWCDQVGLSLPTEAQWEYMCRAGSTTAWTTGAEKQDLHRIANLGSAECPPDWLAMPGITEPWHDGFGAEAAPVGSFGANAFGLFDVHGNVCEWTRDHYQSYAIPVVPGTGLRPGKSGERIARGGNFGMDANSSRSAARFHCGAGVSPGANNGFGFRPSRDLSR